MKISKTGFGVIFVICAEKMNQVYDPIGITFHIMFFL